MTKPEVFIIESLKFSEEADYREGEMIYRSLRMSLKGPHLPIRAHAHGVRTFRRRVRGEQLRYLHISCHGSKGGSA